MFAFSISSKRYTHIRHVTTFSSEANRYNSSHSSKLNENAISIGIVNSNGLRGRRKKRKKRERELLKGITELHKAFNVERNSRVYDILYNSD